MKTEESCFFQDDTGAPNKVFSIFLNESLLCYVLKYF